MNIPPPAPPDIHSEDFLHSLMRRQLKLSIACAAAFMVALLGLPLLNYFAPELMARRVLGFTLTWFILGVLFFPFVWIIAFAFIRRSIALEEAEVAEAKPPVPSPKLQTSSKPPTRDGSGSARALLLGLGIWNLFEVSSLGFGV